MKSISERLTTSKRVNNTDCDFDPPVRTVKRPTDRDAEAGRDIDWPIAYVTRRRPVRHRALESLFGAKQPKPIKSAVERLCAARKEQRNEAERSEGARRARARM